MKHILNLPAGLFLLLLSILKSPEQSTFNITEAATGGVLWKKLLLKILQNSKENTCDKVSFLIKLHAAPATLLKKRLWHWCFPVNFAKFLRTPFSNNTFGQLLLMLLILYLSTTIRIQFWIIKEMFLC